MTSNVIDVIDVIDVIENWTMSGMDGMISVQNQCQVGGAVMTAF